jgi:hypothetical protein
MHLLVLLKIALVMFAVLLLIVFWDTESHPYCRLCGNNSSTDGSDPSSDIVHCKKHGRFIKH